jgi:hypothetical protein
MKKTIFLTILLVAAFLITGCTKSKNTPPQSTPSIEAIPTRLPDAAYTSNGGGEPRNTAYWALWNTCAPENRADVAKANGGREAGWFLMDDLIADPGIQIGDFRIDTCEQGLALLEGHSTDGEDFSGDAYRLAGQLLAAELNLNVGAESCPIAEEAVIGSHITLSNLGFDGTGTYDDAIASDLADSLTTFLELLMGYNSGELCIN